MKLKISDTIYDTLVKQFGVKFKAQYNSSPLVFERYLEVKDIITNKAHFALILDSKKVIKFCDKDEFIKSFIVFVETELRELDNRFNELQRIANEERFADENQLFFEHEEIGYKGAKYNALLKKFKSF